MSKFFSHYATGDYDLIHGFIEDEIFDTYKDALADVATIFENEPDRDSVSVVYIHGRDREGMITETTQLAKVTRYAVDPATRENEDD